ncbi:MAG: phenylalanine--tRNA ligase subunit beta [Planctomycetes bacterium]|nr:phenylalanine--tRNA ligase subunit beta [Planctomycetota bacterium]NOG54782.1 phenylalanine--tRNA ligase subunit beta [Planctomycetota bacterium]
MPSARFPPTLATMNVSTKWINEYLDRPATTEELSEVLPAVGFALEEAETLGADGDARLDLEITSNRGDCVSIIGLARECAAATGRTLKLPDCSVSTVAEQAADVTSVENHELELCPYYSARILRGVKVGPSPDWLKQRIESVGLRSVNNVVDVTNFVLFELGQPLHTFDLAKLKEQRIVVRCARSGETMTAIDGSKLTLDPSMLIIADAEVPVAVAGVMGGLETEISETTTDILLEAASFSPPSVRTTSRKLKLFSDSSYRFERGVHPNTVSDAADRAAQLIMEVGGGTCLAGSVVAAAPPPQQCHVALRPAKVCEVAGVDIPTDTMLDMLSRLGMEVALKDGAEAIDCVIPWHRLDLTREVDLVEEVIRLYGFDRIEPVFRMEVEVVGEQLEVVNARRVDHVLAGSGFHEVVTHSFSNEADAQAFLPPGDFELLSISDDQKRAQRVLRPSIVPSLLRCRKRNQDVGNRDVRLFEHAACYVIREGEKIERTNLALIMDAPDPQAGLREVRGVLDAVIRTVVGHGGPPLRIRPIALPWYAPEGAACLLVGDDEVVGSAGLLSPAVQKQFDLQTQVVAAELCLEPYLSAAPDHGQLLSLSTFPAIQRDLSVVVDEPVAWSKIEEVVAQSELSLLESVEFAGLYRSPKQIGPGRKSVTLRLTFRDSQRTLRHEEVDPQIDTVVQRLAAETGAQLRQ